MANEQNGINLYYKLHRCLKIALTAPPQKNGDELSCHANNIICHLAKSIESGETWFDPTVEVWCDYFVSQNEKNTTVYETVTQDQTSIAKLLAALPVIEAPWDEEFRKRYCSECLRANCDDESECPYQQFRNNPEWWLSLDAAGVEI